MLKWICAFLKSAEGRALKQQEQRLVLSYVPLFMQFANEEDVYNMGR